MQLSPESSVELHRKSINPRGSSRLHALQSCAQFLCVQRTIYFQIKLVWKLREMTAERVKQHMVFLILTGVQLAVEVHSSLSDGSVSNCPVSDCRP